VRNKKESPCLPGIKKPNQGKKLGAAIQDREQQEWEGGIMHQFSME